MCVVVVRAVLWAAWVSVASASLTGLLGRHGPPVESSGGGPDEPAVRGSVRVVRLDPRDPARPGLPGRGPSSSFPAFLSRGRALAPGGPAAASPLRLHLRPEKSRQQGVRMWQRAVEKDDQGRMSVGLPVSLKEATTLPCTAVPFTQRVTERGCDVVTVRNRLCFGQCTSLFVPAAGAGAGFAGHAPCSRCAPSKARAVSVPLRCGARARQRRVLVVEECRCETGREEGDALDAEATVQYNRSWDSTI